MYIKQAFKNKHDWWLYVAGLALIVIAVILGQIPHTIALIAKAMQLGLELGELDPNKMMQLLESNLNLFLMLLSFAVGLVGLFIVVKFLHKQSIKSLTTSRSKIDWKRFWFAFLFWGFISVIMIMIDYQSSPENYASGQRSSSDGHAWISGWRPDRQWAGSGASCWASVQTVQGVQAHICVPGSPLRS